MDITQLLLIITNCIIGIFLFIFLVSSFIEKKSRAGIIGILLLISIVLFTIAGLLIYPFVLLIYIVLFWSIVILFFLPIENITAINIGDITKQVDERDTIFAREEYLPGTDKYDTYYSMHPEKKEVDDKIRQLPQLLDPGGKYYDEIRSNNIISTFNSIKDMVNDVDGEINASRQELEPNKITEEIKKSTFQLGADEVGVARLNPMYVYSHVGRGPEPWSEPIINNHKYVIAFSIEMDYFKVESAPQLPITEETADKYLQAAKISIELARHIRYLGYPARAHISDSNYQIMLPPVAYDAGLGELGRLGYLISPRFGARIRLGGVTTDLPLIPDKPIDFGVQNFCEKCLKCAENCPSNAIPHDKKINIRGAQKWQLNIEQCLRYWRLVGTDCGICMKVCPFSHPPTIVHNIVRAGIKRSSPAQTVSLWADDLFYGRKAQWDKI